MELSSAWPWVVTFSTQGLHLLFLKRAVTLLTVTKALHGARHTVGAPKPWFPLLLPPVLIPVL